MSRRQRDIQSDAHPTQLTAPGTHVVSFSASSSYEGPIPPEMLAEYERVLPGSADRFLTMMEAQASHRIDLETRVIANDVRQSSRGLLVTAWIATLGFGAAIVCAWRSQGIYAATIVGVLGSILGGGYGAALLSRGKERDRRWQQRPVKPKP